MTLSSGIVALSILLLLLFNFFILFALRHVLQIQFNLRYYCYYLHPYSPWIGHISDAIPSILTCRQGLPILPIKCITILRMFIEDLSLWSICIDRRLPFILGTYSTPCTLALCPMGNGIMAIPLPSILKRCLGVPRTPLYPWSILSYFEISPVQWVVATLSVTHRSSPDSASLAHSQNPTSLMNSV